jgi:hypothetical protein
VAVFAFYIIAILVILTLCAALADLLGWLFPEWMAEEER